MNQPTYEVKRNRTCDFGTPTISVLVLAFYSNHVNIVVSIIVLLLIEMSCFAFILFEGFSKTDHHRSDSAPAVELKPLPKGKYQKIDMAMNTVLNCCVCTQRVFVVLFQNLTMVIAKRKPPKAKGKDRRQNQVPIPNRIYLIQR